MVHEDESECRLDAKKQKSPEMLGEDERADSAAGLQEYRSLSPYRRRQTKAGL